MHLLLICLFNGLNYDTRVVLKIVFFGLIFFVSSVRAEVWICNVQEKPDMQIVFDSSNKNLWLQKDDREINLISDNTISSWQMLKEKCNIRADSDQGDQYNMYSVTFRCAFKLGGSFQFDFKSLGGYYLEDLYQGGNRNLYNFDSCHLNVSGLVSGYGATKSINFIALL